MLNGDAGNDVIQGDSCNVHISGGNRDNILTMGPGKDHFNCGAGIDTITDFQPVVETKSANCENSSTLNSTKTHISAIDRISAYLHASMSKLYANQ